MSGVLQPPAWERLFFPSPFFSGAKATLMQEHRKPVLGWGFCHRILREGRNVWKCELQIHQQGLV